MNELQVIANPGETTITMIRDFDAPRELVYRAYTDSTLIPQWWGMRNEKTVVDTMNVVFGGAWRYIINEDNGTSYAFKGVYHEVKPNERLVYTFEYEPLMGHILLESVRFEDLGNGKTRVHCIDAFETMEDKNGMMDSGMESGAKVTMDRLDELLQTLK